MLFAIAVLTTCGSGNMAAAIPIAFAVRSVAAQRLREACVHARLNWLMLPMEDLAEFCFWVAGFFGNTIVWRGRRYRLERTAALR